MILDLCCVLTILIGIVIGYVRGLFKMVAHLTSQVLAILIAIIASGIVATLVYDKVVEPKLSEIIVARIDETGVEGTVSELYTMVASIKTGIAGSEVIDNLGETANTIKENIDPELVANVKGAYEELSGYFKGISPSITGYIADKIDLEQFTEIKDAVTPVVDDTLEEISPESVLPSGEKVTNDLLNLLEKPLTAFIKPVAFVVIYLVAVIILGIILNGLASLLEKIEITEKLSNFGGAIVGGVCTLAIVLLISALCSIIITPDNSYFGLIDNSVAIKATTQLLALTKT